MDIPLRRTTTTTTTTTTTIITEDSGDILDGDNGFVLPRYEGDMDTDWGGQGPCKHAIWKQLLCIRYR